MSPKNWPLLLMRLSRLACAFGLFFFTQTSVAKDPPPPTPLPPTAHVPCKQELLSRRTLSAWGVTREKIDHWQNQPSTAPILQALIELDSALKEAPNSALEIISLLSYTHLRDDLSTRKLIKHLRRQGGLDQAMEWLGKSVDEVAPFLANLYVAPHLLKGEAKTWMQHILRSRFMALLIASRMANAPLPSFGKPVNEGDLLNQGKFTSTTHALFHMRASGSGQVILGPMIRTSLPVAASFIRSMIWMANISSSAENRTINHSLSLWLSEADHRDMVEWVLAKLSKRSPPHASVPEKWKRFYASVFKYIELPTSKWMAGKNNLKAYTVGDGALLDVIHGLFRFVKEETGQDLKQELTTDPEELSHNLRKLLLAAPAAETFRSEDAGVLVRLMLIVAGVGIPSNSEVRHSLASTIAQVVKSIALYSTEDKSAERASDYPYATSLIDAEFDPFDITDAMSSSVSARQRWLDLPLAKPELHEGDWDLNDIISGRVPISELQTDVIYTVKFKRPDHRFSDLQKVSFSPLARKKILRWKSKGDDPYSWLEAIQMGIAHDHGQRGLKIFRTSETEHLRFEIKLLLTPYRLFGHRTEEGVWYVDSLENHH